MRRESGDYGGTSVKWFLLIRNFRLTRHILELEEGGKTSTRMVKISGRSLQESESDISISDSLSLDMSAW